MPDNNAAKSVHQYLLAENIQIDLEEFTFQAKTHPDYPSVLAYSDTLHFFGIGNKAVRLSHTELEALPQQFIALMVDFDEQEMLAFVQRKENSFQYSKNGKPLQLNHTQFAKEWKGVILLVEGQEAPPTPKKNVQRKNIALLVLGLLLLLMGLLGANGVHYMPIILLLITAAGLYLSVLAINAELGLNEGTQPLFCTSLPKGDCNTVIGSTKGTIFNLVKITDACMVFFTAQFLALLLFHTAGWITIFYAYTFIALVAALPITFYSIYVQVAVEKKWCTICLAITALLYLQLGIVGPVVVSNFQWGGLWELCVYTAFFAITLSSWLSIKALLSKHKTLKQAYKKAVTFKRNFKQFRYALLQSKWIDIKKTQQDIVLGNTDAPLQITLVTNPFCGYCAEAHKILIQLLKSYGDQLSIAIRFNYTGALNAEQKQLYLQLIALYEQKGPAVFMEALGEWFVHKDYAKWAARFANTAIHNEVAIAQWLQQQTAWNHAQGLNFTPAFLMGPYLYPMAYEREDLLYFIPELIEDETILFVKPSIEQ
jgi:thiol-disulfide isomerase/thioredoxin